MADEVQESPEESKEQTEALPTPSVSEASPERPPSAPSGVTEERLAELLEKQREALLEEFQRQNQSVKDKRIAAIQKDVEELRDIKANLEALGGDWEKLEAETAQQSLARRLQQLEERASSPQDPGRSWEQRWQANARAILGKAEERGVELTAEELAAVTGREYSSEEEAIAGLNDAVFAKMRGEAIPAAAVATEGGETAEPSDALQSVEKLNRLKEQGGSKADIEAAYQEMLRDAEGLT